MSTNQNIPKISIVVPVYNVEAYLHECMESILQQTLYEIEVICIDDGSTDSSGIMLDEYAKKDPRVKVFHRVNGGYGKAMNYGISQSIGEYIGIVEPDDYIELNMFEVLYKFSKSNNLDFIKSNFKRFYGEKNNRTFEDVPLTTKKDFYGRIINPCKEPIVLKLTMNIWTGIYNRSFIENHKICFHETPGASFQDNGFWIKTMTLAQRVYFIDEYFYMNRRDNPNSSVKNTEKALYVINEFKYIDDFLNNNPKNKSKIINYYVFVKLVGYLGVYNRSSTEQKILFLLEASKELKKHMEAGEIERSLYGPTRWKQLNQIIANPVEFFIEDMGGNGNSAEIKLRETYEKIAVAQNQLSILMQSYRNYADRTLYNMNCVLSVKVSVIIPAYNVEAYISQCLDSIISQSLKEIEVICIDDGSTDNTFSIMMEYVKKDRRIIALSQINSGSGSARNKAMDIAKGQYVAFIDADDWYPNELVLEKMYNKAVENEALICGGSISAYTNDGKTIIPPLSYYNFTQEGFISYSNYQLEYGYTRYIYNLEFLKKNSINIFVFKILFFL